MKLAMLGTLFIFALLLACTSPDQPPNPGNTTTPPPVSNNSTGTVNDSNGGTGTGGGITIPPEINTTQPGNNSTGTSGSGQNTTIDLVNERILGQKLIFAQTPSSPLEAYIYNIGIGQAILIRKGDFNMLIDTGKPESANQVVANLRYSGIERIDVLALTNNKPEHAGGLSEVLNSFSISEIWTNNVQPAGDAKDAYDKYITGRIPVKHPWQGDSVKLNGIKLTVLNPPNSTMFVGEDVNSIVLKIEDRGTCMMVMSDVTSSIEDRFISNNMNLTCNLLVLGNHGSGLSSDLLFIEKVFPDWNQPAAKRKPELALISAGTEEANYPNSAVLERLRLKHIPYVSTTTNGTLKVVIDSVGYNVITMAG